MQFSPNTHEKIMSAYSLLQGEEISISTFEHIRKILKGLHPKIDEKLEICSKALDKLQKIQKGDIITLSVEELAEDTEENKKRKKILLFFIESFNNLKNEITRINAEFNQAKKNGNSLQSKISAWGRIIGFAKGPFGIATLIALIVVGFLFLQHANNSQVIQVITYNGKQIPLNQLYIGRGSDCDSPHYHAVTGSVIALDKTVIPDPENCGYGKLKDVQVTKVKINISN